MNDSPSSRYGLFILSGVLLAVALGTWTVRAQRAADPVASGNSGSGEQVESKVVESTQQRQHAVALLFRAFHADNYLTYSAVSDTTANYGGRKMNVIARMTRAPKSLSIEYTSGPQEGLQSGFTELWFWRRQRPNAQLEAYAAMQLNAPEIAVRRFALMLENYDVKWKRRDTIDGHPVEIVELQPFHPCPGARGPRKSLAIDTKTGLTLLVETFDHQDRLVMRTKLSDVDYTPKTNFISVDEIKKVSHKKDWIVQDVGDNSTQVARLTGLQPPKPSYVPAGFKFDTVGVHHCSYKNAPFRAALTRYTDGINSLTIFALNSKSAAGLANCPPTAVGAGGYADSQKKPFAQTPSLQPITYPADKTNNGQACDFGAGTLSTRDTPQGRLVAVGDLPSSELRRVLDSAAVLPVKAPSKPAKNVKPNRAR